MNNKKVYIIHGWGGDPKVDWYVWLENQLQDKGFEVCVLAMPNPESPDVKEWTDFISNQVGEPNDNILFIGHSVGCQAILRYLQESQTRALGVICVAGWFMLKGLDAEEEEIAELWLDISLIDFKKIRKNVGKLVAIFSDNDPYVPLVENKKVFEEELNAEIIIQKNKGHFTEEDGIRELPVVLEEVLKIKGGNNK